MDKDRSSPSSCFAPWFARGLMLLGATVVGLLVAEAIARLVAPYPMTYSWMGQINGVIAPLPNVHGRHFVPGVYDTSFSFSPQRFRGQQIYTPEPGPNVLRIAALGASFTFGSGANDVDAYPFQLQTILQQHAKQGDADQTVEVINAGISGSAVAEQALWYQNWVSRFHPRLVILNVGCAVDHFTGLFVTDANGNVTPRPTAQVQAAAQETNTVRTLASRLPGFRFLAEHSEFFNLLRISEGRVISHRRDVALVGNGLPDLANPPQQFQLDELKREAGEVLWLSQQVKQSGARMAVAVLPCRENVYNDAPSKWIDQARGEYPLVVSSLRDVSSNQGMPFTELSGTLRDIARNSPPLYYNGKYETHPTPAGYRAIAEVIAGFLVDQRLLSPAH